MATIFGLVKFLETEYHVRDFIEGKLYLNRLSYFKRIEESTTVTRKDKHEGVVQWLQPGDIHLEINGYNLSDDLAGPLSVQMDWLDHIHVFCMTAIHSADLDIEKMSDEKIALLNQQLEVDPACSAFGPYAVAVTNVTEFFLRFQTAAKRRNSNWWRGLVKYYDPLTLHGGWEGIEPTYWKREEYQYQKEYRLAFNDGSLGTDPTVVDVGSLHDIATCVPTREFNRLLRLHVSNGVDQ